MKTWALSLAAGLLMLTVVFSGAGQITTNPTQTSSTGSSGGSSSTSPITNVKNISLSGGTYTVATGDETLVVTANNTAYNITLPSVSSSCDGTGKCRKIVIKDVTGAAGSAGIAYIDPASFIDGQGFGVITTNYGAVTLTADSALGSWITTPDAKTYQIPTVTVSQLGSCGSGQSGTIKTVSDASSPTYGVTVTGGGSAGTPVYCDGLSWKAH